MMAKHISSELLRESASMIVLMAGLRGSGMTVELLKGEAEDNAAIGFASDLQKLP
jgi:hypothetical protein